MCNNPAPSQSEVFFMMYCNQIAALYSWDPMTIASQWNAHFLLNISFPIKLLDPVYGKGWSGESEMEAACHYRTWIKLMCMPLHLWRLIKSHAIPVIENSEIDFGCKFTVRNPETNLDSVCLFSFSSLNISNFQLNLESKVCRRIHHFAGNHVWYVFVVPIQLLIWGFHPKRKRNFKTKFL